MVRHRRPLTAPAHLVGLRFEVEVFSPCDDPVRTDLTCHRVGKASHCGPKAVERVREILKIMHSRSNTDAMLAEYDSFYIGRNLPR